MSLEEPTFAERLAWRLVQLQNPDGTWARGSIQFLLSSSVIARHEAEAEALRKAAVPTDLDEWGGWSAGPQLKATGWFRTEKLDGRWWLVTPSGHRFWSVGLDCVGPEASGPLKGQEELFSWRPAATDPLYAFGWKHGWVTCHSC